LYSRIAMEYEQGKELKREEKRVRKRNELEKEEK
jgi:hypothetical protein